jgi:hypothetical protein
MTDLLTIQLASDIQLATNSVRLFSKSVQKSQTLLNQSAGRQLSDDERETLESLTSRYGRALDFLTQRLLRTIDKIELTDEGSVLDRVNRFKKRGVLRDEINYGLLKDLRNRIVHEYIIDESDSVVKEVLTNSHLIVEMFEKAVDYCSKKGLVGP